MSDQAKKDGAPEENVSEDNDMNPKAATSGAGGEKPFEADYEALVKLANENEELKDRSLRLAADMENLRRRTARDVHDARTYAIANFARDMLSVSDDLRRALDAIPAETKTSGDGGFKALIEGVELTERSMLAALERHGVKKLQPEGEKFDPNFHQAMFEVPNPDVPAGTVIQVVQTGYVIGDRVLRPALVGVSKGGPKSAAPEPAAEPGGPGIHAEKDA
jgi:molecular chaperone GrpE